MGRLCPNCGYYQLEGGGGNTSFYAVVDPDDPNFGKLVCLNCLEAFYENTVPYKDLNVNPYTHVAEYETSAFTSHYPDGVWAAVPFLVMRSNNFIQYDPFMSNAGDETCWAGLIGTGWSTGAGCGWPSVYLSIYVPRGYSAYHPLVHLYSCYHGSGYESTDATPGVVCPYPNILVSGA